MEKGITGEMALALTILVMSTLVAYNSYAITEIKKHSKQVQAQMVNNQKAIFNEARYIRSEVRIMNRRLQL